MEKTNPQLARSVEKAFHKEVIAIGDSDGSLTKLKWNLENAGVIDARGDWKAGNRRVVIHGDILADRNLDGFDILKKIRSLRKQAREAGGDISVLVGNHDDQMLSFLLQRDVGAISGSDGMLELTKFSGNRKLFTEGNRFDALKARRLNRNEILRNMLNSPEGRILLEEMCKMKLCEKIGDALYIHTDPSSEILELVLKHGVDKINQDYQTALRATLFGGKKFNEKVSDWMDVFLDTENRAAGDLATMNAIDLNAKFVERFQRELGVDVIAFGHSNLKGKRVTELPGYQDKKFSLVNVDHGRKPGVVSAAKIGDDIKVGKSVRD